MLSLGARRRSASRLAAPPPELGSVRPSSASTAAEIRRLQAAVRRSPGAAAPRVALAGEYLQRVRETGDAAFYARAETLLRGVLARDPDNADALVAPRRPRAVAPRLPRRAARSRGAPTPACPRCPSTVDALVELGRYGEARRALQRLANLKPNLSTYARVSYLRELHGDLRGAASALALASAAGGPAPENAAAIDVLRGDLALVRGAAGARPARRTPVRWPRRRGTRRRRPGRARRCAGRHARAGLARLGHPPLPRARRAAAAARVRRSRSARPSWPPGGARAAREDLALVRVQQRLLARAGVNTDVELAVFESDHGSRARGLRARAARVGGGAERALRRRARLGADAQRAAARRDGAGRGALGGSGPPTRCSRSTRA